MNGNVESYKVDPAYCGEYENRRPDGSRAERRLMLAVLEDAIRCYQGAGDVPGRNPANLDPRSRIERLALEARRWIFGGDDPHEEKLTFEVVCEGLGIDCDSLRIGLKKAQLLKRRSRQPVNSNLIRVIAVRPRRGPRRILSAVA